MRNKIEKLFDSTVGLLVFALLSGCAYFVILRELVLKGINGSGLISFFFFPAIICGAALVLIKLIRRCRENEEPAKAHMLFWIHVILVIIAIVALIASFV